MNVVSGDLSVDRDAQEAELEEVRGHGTFAMTRRMPKSKQARGTATPAAAVATLAGAGRCKTR